MPQLLLDDVDDDLLQRLAARARHNGRTAASEARAVLETALRDDATPIGPFAPFAARSNRLRARFGGRMLSDSSEQIRADRDRDAP